MMFFIKQQLISYNKKNYRTKLSWTFLNFKILVGLNNSEKQRLIKRIKKYFQIINLKKKKILLKMLEKFFLNFNYQ